MAHDNHVTLRPDRGVTGRWSAIGLLATGLATWVAVDARDSVLAWAFMALCVVVTSYVVIQLVQPGRFEMRLDPAGLDVRLPWQHMRVPWERVHLARVVTITGEPVLELHLWDEQDPAQSTPQATGVLLPIGADLDLLHEHLGRHLGRVEDAPSRPTPPSPA